VDKLVDKFGENRDNFSFVVDKERKSDVMSCSSQALCESFKEIYPHIHREHPSLAI
jgi:hypothetical protein